jgi:hypothetical protein
MDLDLAVQNQQSSASLPSGGRTVDIEIKSLKINNLVKLKQRFPQALNQELQ